MRRRAFLTTVWVGLLAGCSGRDDGNRSQTTETTETTYGYGGVTATETATKRGTPVTTHTTTADPTATATATEAADDYGEQRYGTHGYGG